jgi:hypothetical protein
MPVSLKVKANPTRQYPVRGDNTNYGTDATLWAQDVTMAINSIGAQYAWIMGSVAQVVSGEATHSSWITLLADATDGDSVWVKKGTYTFGVLFDFTKRLTIHNECTDCIYEATAGIAAGAILRFSAAGTSFIGGTISAGAGTPDYAFDVNAIDVEMFILLSGVFALGDILFTLGAATFSGIVRTAIAATVYGLAAAAGANTFLSNLANPTTVNQTLTPAADITQSLGTAPKRWLDGFISRIQGTDLVGGTVGNVTPVTIAKIDNIVIDGDSITDTTNDLAIVTTGAVKDIRLNATGDVVLNPASNLPLVDISGTEYNLNYDVAIQAFTAVGTVGAASQFMAGTIMTLAELQNFFGAAHIYCYYRFGAGAALGTDDNGAYNYTLGAAAKAPANGLGILNTNYAISFDGGDYATNTTKLDNIKTFFNHGFIHSFWFIAPTDGQPAADMVLYYKSNAAATDFYEIILTNYGILTVSLYSALGVNVDLASSSVLPNGANTIWTHVVVCWDPTYGARLYINGVMEYCETDSNVIMANGTNTDFFIGASTSTPTNPFTGRIANEVMINAIAEQRDINLLYAATIPEPAVLLGKEYTIIEKVRPEANANFEYQSNCQIVTKYNSKIWLQGRQYGATDTVKLIGEVL